MSDNYQNDVKRESITAVKAILAEMPPFLGAFFRSLEDRASPRTRYNYAKDLRLFFQYLADYGENLTGRDLKTLKARDLEDVTPDDVEGFMSNMSLHTRVMNVHDGGEPYTVEYTNAERGKARKLSAVSSMYDYYIKRRDVTKNPAAIVSRPKLREKAIVRLEPDEVAKLLDEAETGEHLPPRQKAFHDKTKLRDLAILTLLLGTGLRVSECVGINIEHLDFNVNGVKVTRKGGKEAVVYFGDEVADALNDYLDEREFLEAEPGHESALFLSLKKRRMDTYTVECMVKKYARHVTTLKNITPHKLRSTYGTELYRATEDIYLVAGVLGHTSVDTTRKHYVPLDDDKRRDAANKVKLRKE